MLLFLKVRKRLEMGNKIVVGMSGGVDSSMSLVILKKQGWHPVGVSLKLQVWKDKDNVLRENVCCTKESFDIAKEICKKLNVPYFIFDAKEEFEKAVMDYFVSDLKKNRTPNPCVVCNRYLKFKKLFEWGKKHNIKYVATGHYARVRFNTKSKKYGLLKAKDKEKDQSYGLSFLPQKWLKYIKLPLGNYTKKQVYNFAMKKGFELFLKRKQSQDLCFVSKKALPKFIEEKVGKNPGRIIDTEGNVLGEHKGLHFYTIGQKRKLCLPGAYFVKGSNVRKNELVVTKNIREINQKEIILKPFNFISGEKPDKKVKVMAKVGYGLELSKAVIFPPEKGHLRLVFNKPKSFVRAGQFCAFYKRDVCLGSGVIN